MQVISLSSSVTTKDMQTPPPHPVLIRFSWNMRNVVERMKNRDFYFSSYRENSSKIEVIFSTKVTLGKIGSNKLHSKY